MSYATNEASYPHTSCGRSYYEKHKPVVLEKARREITCECGFIIRYSNKSSHKKTQSHIIWEQSRKAKKLHEEKVE